MAADDRDPITGAYIFLDTGAPDTGVDPTLVSEQANDVGTRIIRANFAALEDYEYNRAGMMGHALDTRSDYIHNGTGYVKVLSDTGWQDLTPFNTGWTTEGSDTPQYRVLNGSLVFRGRIDATVGAGTLPFVNPLPAGARPSRDTGIFVGVTSGATPTHFVFAVSAAGVITVFKGSSAVNDLALTGVTPITLG